MILFVYKCRDGVSEGQFSQVLLHEMDSIRKVIFNEVLCLGLGGHVTWTWLATWHNYLQNSE